MTDSRNADAERMIQSTVVLELHISAPGFTARLASANVMAEDDKADAALIHVSKDLIDRNALASLTAHRAAFLKWLWGRRVPCKVLAPGMHLVPLRLVQEIDERLATYKTERAALVEALLAEYPKLCAQAKERLAGHYNADDYPAVEDLRKAFGVTYRFLSMNVPAALEGLNRELYAREQERVRAEWANAADDVRNALRQAFADLTGHLAARLAPGEDGKPKTFRGSTLEALREFIGTFADRNIAGDAELTPLVKQARALLDGVEPAALRSQGTTRERIVAGFAEINQTLATLGVEPKKSRRIAAEGEV